MNPCTILGRKVAREIAFERNTAGHMAIADREPMSPNFSPEELQVMVERWKRDHASSLRKCLIPGTKLITEAGCREYLRGLRESRGDDLWESFTEKCRECRKGEDLDNLPHPHKTPTQRAKASCVPNAVSFKRRLVDDLSIRDVSRHLKKSVRFVEGLIQQGKLKATKQKARDGSYEYTIIKREDFAAFKRGNL